MGGGGSSRYGRRIKSTEMSGKKVVVGTYGDDIDNNDNNKNKMEIIITVQK